MNRRRAQQTFEKELAFAHGWPSERIRRRFYKFVGWRTLDECWIWTGGKTTGYGHFWALGKTYQAHRILFTVICGPIPFGLTLDHLCKNHGCVNPRHLEAVTDQVNILRGDGPAAENARRTHCKIGHPLTRDVPGGGCRICRRKRDRESKKLLRKIARGKAI